MTINKELLISKLKELRVIASKCEWVAEHLEALLGEANCLYCIYWRKDIDPDGLDFERATYFDLLLQVERHAKHLRLGYDLCSKRTNSFIPEYLEEVTKIIEEANGPKQ